MRFFGFGAGFYTAGRSRRGGDIHGSLAPSPAHSAPDISRTCGNVTSDDFEKWVGSILDKGLGTSKLPDFVIGKSSLALLAGEIFAGGQPAAGKRGINMICGARPANIEV